ncbi:MAG: hypothetical protein JW993_06570 [Sedimentisphaerales bacterium]|nr:hypothetical protein [Sedimentisphaerales bacterium]
MNLVKWFRKNNTKLMAVVVIVLMVGFIGGSSLSYLLRGSGGLNKTVARYGEPRKKITPADRLEARQELEILQSLRLDRVLQSQDLRGLLLHQLLFTQSQGSGSIMELIRQTIQQNRYRISDAQLEQMRVRTVPGDIYWLLLRNEAEAAGFHRSIEEMGELMGQLIPRLFENQSYATVMRAQVNRFGVPERTILATFGRLVAVLEYAAAICSLDSVTTAQTRYLAAVEGETMDIEYVQIDAETFADANATPSMEELQTQFDKYKDSFPGQVSDANPFGFGYKLRPRVQVDYIALKLEDVSSVVKAPTAQEMETFYRDNRDVLYTQQVPVDPNKPEGETVAQVRRYPEVAESIRTRLLRERVTSRAEQILLDARGLADAKLAPGGAEEDKPSLEELAKTAGDYAKIAQDLGQKYGLAIYSGRTGLLSAADIQQDEHLGRLALTDYGYSPIRLSQMLFSVEALGDDAVTLLSGPSAEMYRSIGPARDPAAAAARDMSGRIMALVRVVDARPSGVPDSLDMTFSTKTLGLGETPDEADDLYSVRKNVTEDVRKLAVWDKTKTRAAEFAALAVQDGWEQAVNEFNELHGERVKDDPNDPNVFSVDRLVGLQPIASEQLSAIRAQTANNPSAASFVESLSNQRRFINRLYALVPPGADSLPESPVVLEYRPDLSVYCLKSINIQRLTQERFQQMKGMLLRRDQYTDAQTLAIVHFMPKNILERMQFDFIEESVVPVEDDTPPPPIEDAF